MENPEITVFAGEHGVLGASPQPDVLSMDATGTRYEAIAVCEGVIVAAGRADEVNAYAADRQAPVTRVDLDGHVLMPGINDSHLHAAWLGARWPALLFGEATSPPDPLCTTRQQRREAILRAGELLAAAGITSCTEPGIGPGEDAGETGCFGSEVEEVYRELSAAGLLRQRVNLLGLHGILDGPSSLEDVSAGIAEQARAAGQAQAAAGVGAHQVPNDFVRTGIKIFADLIPATRQAWTSHPYDDGTHGGLLVSGADLDEQEANLRAMVRLAQQAGQQIGVHATGDRAIETVLDELETFAVDEVRALAHSIIHGDLATPGQVRRMAALGMWFNVQSGIAATTREWLRPVLPDAAVDAAWPIDAGLAAGNLVLSSDSPILDFDWRAGLADAEELLARSGTAPDRHRLLRTYTAIPAMQDRAQTWKGTIEVGKVADLVLLTGDPMHGDLRSLEVAATYLAGRPTFSREAVQTSS